MGNWPTNGGTTCCVWLSYTIRTVRCLPNIVKVSWLPPKLLMVPKALKAWAPHIFPGMGPDPRVKVLWLRKSCSKVCTGPSVKLCMEWCPATATLLPAVITIALPISTSVDIGCQLLCSGFASTLPASTATATSSLFAVAPTSFSWHATAWQHEVVAKNKSFQNRGLHSVRRSKHQKKEKCRQRIAEKNVETFSLRRKRMLAE